MDRRTQKDRDLNRAANIIYDAFKVLNDKENQTVLRNTHCDYANDFTAEHLDLLKEAKLILANVYNKLVDDDYKIDISSL